MKILVTGGAGYIGSHTCIELIKAGHEPVVVDSYVNSFPEATRRVEKITGKKVKAYEADIRDRKALDRIFSENKFDYVIHFAGLKAVGESCAKPLEYYDNNIGGTLCLLQAMRDHGVKRIVFSSSATVYGTPERLPLDEDCRVGGTTNPYGTSKLYQEGILRDLYAADSGFTVVILRYFNPVGAHESGLIGEDPQGIPNNLTPYIGRVITGKLKEINVFGDDYDTPDGTGVRDYIHVVDLARGHVAAIKALKEGGVHIYNLGTGNGYSVLDMVKAFSKACGKELPYEILPRRAGDVPACYATSAKAEKDLNWKAQFDLDDMCRDQWNWQKNNPNGYEK